ncbi:MAG: hypothetical protein R3Y53_00985 [Bacillota bacterium]
MEHTDETEQKSNIEEVTSPEKEASSVVQENIPVQEKRNGWYDRFFTWIKTKIMEPDEDDEYEDEPTESDAKMTDSAEVMPESTDVQEELTDEERKLAKKEARIKRKEEQKIAPLTFFQCLVFALICVTPVLDFLFLLFWACPWKYSNLSRKRMARAAILVKLLMIAVFGSIIYRETQHLLEYYESFFYEYNTPEYNMPEYYAPKQKEFLFPVESA